MSVDQTSLDRIRNATFPASWAWRGYDKVEVEKFLGTLANWLEAGGAPTAEPDTVEQELSVQGDAIKTLEERIGELEREVANANRRERRLAGQLDKARKKLESRAAEDADASARAKKTRAPARRKKRTTSSWAKLPKGRLDINQASFDQLRALGLSISHCARLLALRDLRGGFTSLDVLDELDGLSQETQVKLRARLVVGSGGGSR
jgi:DivIVA domain-containing protein